MALRSILTPLLVLIVLVAAAPLLGATDGEPKRPRPGHGRLHLVSSKRGAILTGRNLAPGDRVAGSVTITTRGALAGSFALRARVRGSTRLAEHLVLTVRERKRRGSRVVYSGSLARLRAVSLGRIGPRGARTFRFSVWFRSSAPNSLQGRRTTANFTWTAVQPS